MGAKSLARINWMMLSLLLVSGCLPKFTPVQVDDIPITLRQPNEQILSMKTIVENADTQVQKYVPGAYASDLTFLGSCESLSNLDGTLNIIFVKTEQKRFYSQIIVGTISIDTTTQTMEMHFEDHTEHYPSTNSPSVLSEDLLDLHEVAGIAQRHIESLNLASCDVTINYIGDHWLVVCTEAGSGPLGFRICKFEIDSTTLEIQEPE